MLKGKVFIYETKEAVIDKYTMIWYIGKNRYFFALGDDPYSPRGFNLYIGDGKTYKAGKHLGEKLNHTPMNLVAAIKHRIRPLA